MANIENIHANMINNPGGGGDSSSSTRIENPNNSNSNLLEFNCINLNFIVLRNNSRFCVCYAEDGDKPSSGSSYGSTSEFSQKDECVYYN